MITGTWDFFNDVVPEFESYGRLMQVKVCCNKEPHLRGNVYIVYETIREALRAYRGLVGRWYAGKQLTPLFVQIESWKRAICGLFGRGKCPKGSSCNFLHVFRNPGNAFRMADFDMAPPPPQTMGRERWNWSESPERENPERGSRRGRRIGKERRSSRGRSRSRSRGRPRSRSRDRLRSRVKRRTRSRDRCRSRDKCRSRGRHRSRSGGKKRRRESPKREQESSRKEGKPQNHVSVGNLKPETSSEVESSSDESGSKQEDDCEIE